MNTNPMMIYFGQEFGELGMDSEGFSGRDGRTTIFDYWSVDTIRRWLWRQVRRQDADGGPETPIQHL